MPKSCFLIAAFALGALNLFAQKAASAWISTGTVRALLTEEGPLVSSFEAGIDGENQELISEISLWMGAVDPAANLELSIQNNDPALSDFQGGFRDVPLSTDNLHLHLPRFKPCGFRDVPLSTGVWKVTKAEIEQHLNDYLDNGVIDNPIPAIFAWPGRGNPYSEQYNGFAVDSFPWILAAPFGDFGSNWDLEYDPGKGDFPTFGTPIINIQRPPDEIVYVPFHTKRNSALFPGVGLYPVALNCSAVFFTYYCDDAEFLDHTVFGYINLGHLPGEYADSLFAGFKIDGNIGDASDDYLGYIPDYDVPYFYNADTAALPNGLFPPVVGFDMHQGVFDEFGSTEGVSSVITLNPENANVLPPLRYPQLPLEYYRYITGYWRDGSPLTIGGEGYGGSMPANYIFPGAPGEPGAWTELQAQNPPGDRRALVSTGPGFIAGGGYNWVFFSLSYVPGDRGLSAQWEALREYSNHKDNFFYADYFPPAINPYDTLPCFKPTTSIFEQEKPGIKLFPNPVHDLLQIDAGTAEIQSVQIVDLLGRLVFEQDFPAPGSSVVQLETGAFPSGIYILKGKLRDNRAFVGKLVKR